jgi:hypothetical protein
MRTGPQFRHCSQVPLLSRCQAVKAYQEEVLIELANDSRSCGCHVTLCNWRCGGIVPHVVTPLLQKIWIPVSLRGHRLERAVLIFEAKRARSNLQYLPVILVVLGFLYQRRAKGQSFALQPPPHALQQIGEIQSQVSGVRFSPQRIDLQGQGRSVRERVGKCLQRSQSSPYRKGPLVLKLKEYLSKPQR